MYLTGDQFILKKLEKIKKFAAFEGLPPGIF